MKNINNYNFKDKKTLIRVDFNIPMNEELEIVDDIRIQTTLPTIMKVLNDGGSVILLSHLGRPKGKYNPKYSLFHLVSHLQKITNLNIKFSNDCINEEAKRKSSELKPKEMLLLENVRFHKEELLGDEDFAKELSILADVFINDAFGVSHRNHASITKICKYFKDKMMGYVMEKEVNSTDRIIRFPIPPFTTILGGAKVSDKIELIEGLLNKVDAMLIGGGMSNTFLKAMGANIGSSKIEKDKIEIAKNILNKAKDRNIKFRLPSDVYISNRFHNDGEINISTSMNVPEKAIALDIGPQTQQLFGEEIKKSKTILWNGPMGAYEMPNFSEGTRTIAEDISIATDKGAFSLVGGGDTAAAVHLLKYDNKVSHISTGGGALLSYISKGFLEGIQALKE
ncbi:MAG: phosphoglycerate kinase [Bacteroidetes bacterium]|nr:phosphoglycerate kinase [Bacteroidota bacterium]